MGDRGLLGIGPGVGGGEVGGRHPVPATSAAAVMAFAAAGASAAAARRCAMPCPTRRTGTAHRVIIILRDQNGGLAARPALPLSYPAFGG